MKNPRPRLLLLPGLEGSGNLFAGFVEALGHRFETAVVRYPNTCRNYADAAAVVRGTLPQARPQVIVAESFSTPLAIEIATQSKDALDGLVLCNGFVANPLSAFESAWAAAAAPWLFRFPLTGIAATTFLVGPDASEELVQAVRAAIAPVPPNVLYARFCAVLSCDARELLRRIAVPILYLHATRDRLTGAAGLNQVLRVRNDIEVERVDGPHLLLQKEPSTCAEIIARFVERVTAHTIARQ